MPKSASPSTASAVSAATSSAPCYESGRKDIDVVAVNDLGPVETNAHLLRYDSVHGRFPHVVKVDGDMINIGSDKFKVTAIKDPAQLPWKDLGVDIALECTGIFTSRDKASAHLTAGAKRVIVSAPADGRRPDRLSMVSTTLSSPRTTSLSRTPLARPTACTVAKVLKRLRSASIMAS